jgi:hypothetical protein
MLAIGPPKMPLRSADGSQPDASLQHLSCAAYRARTAADIAYAAYGDLVKIDSALCKKLASEAALREPVQRRADQKLNIERRSNVEALLAHMTGQPAPNPCKNCRKGHGPWSQCIVYEGQMCGSCTNCWFNASGSRCTFHGEFGWKRGRGGRCLFTLAFVPCLPRLHLILLSPASPCLPPLLLSDMIRHQLPPRHSNADYPK